MENKKILIIDDEPVLVKALRESFERDGLEVLEAENGKNGLDAALLNHPDLILLDIIMPVMDGMEMLKKLREDIWGKTAKVLILTNLSNGEKEAVAKTLDSYGYLIKTDFKIDDIIDQVKKILKK
ncbi:MAG: response regulator [Patescibacteria group bacterium]